MTTMVFRFFAVSTTSALAPFGAADSELETLAVALETSGFLTGAALSVLHLFATSYFCHFGLEGLRVSLHDLFFGLLSYFGLALDVEAFLATTVWAAYLTACKTFTIEF